MIKQPPDNRDCNARNARHDRTLGQSTGTSSSVGLVEGYVLQLPSHFDLLPRPLIFDLDLWPWPSIRGELWSWPMHFQKVKCQMSVASKHRVETNGLTSIGTDGRTNRQTDGRTDGRRRLHYHDSLTRSIRTVQGSRPILQVIRHGQHTAMRPSALITAAACFHTR